MTISPQGSTHQSSASPDDYPVSPKQPTKAAGKPASRLSCKWTEDDDGNWWTACNNGFIF